MEGSWDWSSSLLLVLAWSRVVLLVRGEKANLLGWPVDEPMAA